MKKILLLCACFIGLTKVSFAQHFAYVDMKYVLGNIPDYNEAQKKVDAQSAQWQKEIQDKYDAIDKMTKDYQGQQVLMSDDMKKQKQQDIADKEKEAKELQKQYFGYDGQLFKLREQLTKPIQDKVYDAVQRLASSKGYDFIFDKSSGIYLMYANPKMDVSDQVLTNLGYSPKVGEEKNKGLKFPSINIQTGSQPNTAPANTPGGAPGNTPTTTPPNTPH